MLPSSSLTCSSTWRDSSVSLNLGSLIITLARSPVPRLDGQVPRKPSLSEYLSQHNSGREVGESVYETTCPYHV